MPEKHLWGMGTEMSSSLSTLVFETESLSLVHWSPLIQVDWLASKSQESCIPTSAILALQAYTTAHGMVLGI